MIRVLLADDHAMVREGLRRILADHRDLVVAAEATDGDEVLRKLGESGADVVVLDIAMPGPGVFDVLAQLRASFPETRTLVLSMHPEQQYATRVIRAGAAGYLTKGRSSEELVNAIRKVYGGGTYVSAALGEMLGGSLRAKVRTLPHHALTNLEVEVLRRLVAGETTKEIWRQLAISPKTVSTYHTRILRKLGLTSTPDLVRYVQEHELF